MTSTQMLDCKNLAPGSRIDVETTSRHYQIECLGGSAIRISGHPKYCPDPVPAHLHGSLDKEGLLEHGLIGKGRRMMFLLDDARPITTSNVVGLRVDKSCAISPNPGQTVH